MNPRLSFILTTLCLFLFVSCEKQKEPPVDELVLYLPFDGNVADKSDNGINTTDNTSGKYVAGRVGKALDLNGTTDFITVDDYIDSGHGLSFSFWMMTRGAVQGQNNGVIIGKYSMALHHRSFLLYSFGSYSAANDNRLSAAFYVNGHSSLEHDNAKSYMEASEIATYPSDPSLWSLINPVRLEKGKWTHCVVNMSSANLEIWINGTLCVKKQREYFKYYDTEAEPVYIGNNPSMGEGSNNHFNGLLDELRIYDRALSRDEIMVLYNYR